MLKIARSLAFFRGNWSVRLITTHARGTPFPVLAVQPAGPKRRMCKSGGISAALDAVVLTTAAFASPYLSHPAGVFVKRDENIPSHAVTAMAMMRATLSSWACAGVMIHALPRAVCGALDVATDPGQRVVTMDRIRILAWQPAAASIKPLLPGFRRLGDVPVGHARTFVMLPIAGRVSWREDSKFRG